MYDALNRLTSKTYPDATAVDYVYDLAGKIKQVSDPTGTYGFAYDNMGRLIATTTQYSFLPGVTYSNAYGYDAASNRTSFTAPDGSTVNYAYDTLSRLTSLTDSLTGQFTFGYDALSRRTSLARPNGVNTSYTYDSLSRLLSVLHQAGTVTLDGASYTYDNAGNRVSKTNSLNNSTENYTYDPLYQLTQVAQGLTTTESYTYDAVGNRLSSLGMTPYAYNSSSELTSTPSATFTYDADGNTLTKVDSSGTTTYGWDFENRLTSVALPGGAGTVTFKYDPFGRRIQKSSASGTTNYLYDGSNSVEEADQTGAELAHYSQGAGVDEPLAAARGGAVGFYEQDGLGSVTSLTASTGAVLNSYTYDAYGNVANSTGSFINPYQFTGRDYDAETGLRYYRARYYDQQTGRFISEDPINFDGGINFYAFVGNSPTNFIDPFGFAQCYYQIAGHTLVCMSDHKPPIGPPYGVQVGPEGVASGGSMQGPTSCTNNNKCQNDRFEGPIVPGYYRMNYDTRPVHQGMDVYRLQPWPHHWYDGLLYDLHMSRGGFELHLGTISLGCINVDKTNPSAAEQYHQLNQLLQSEDGLNYLTVVP